MLTRPGQFEVGESVVQHVLNEGLVAHGTDTMPETATVQIAQPGVYIAMSGQVFDAGAVRKNRSENRFERR